MISSRQELEYYLEADRLALGTEKTKPPLLGSEIWHAQILLRKIEFRMNQPPTLWNSILLKVLKFKYHYYSLALGFYIPPNVCGPGLNVHHHGLVVINQHTRIGKNCCIQQGVNIGRNYSHSEVPVIGDNVFIGPGAKLFGAIKIADDIAIGANAVVTRSFGEKGITIAGNPAKKISDRGSIGMIIRATEILDRRRSGQQL
ncbi:MAG: serine acetyltransferase [Verrucomicrobiales bacterium]|nr:serine acetyltransferase [Verrucomicrobiales bacterium]